MEAPEQEPLAQRPHMVCGLEKMCVTDIRLELEEARSTSFDFLLAPIVHPRYRRVLDGSLPLRDDPLTRSDVLLKSSEWTNFVVGKLSPWIDCDSADAKLRTNSVKAFKEEVAWSTHLSLSAVLVELKSLNTANLAHCVFSLLHGVSYMQIIMRVPLTSPYVLLADDPQAAIAEMALNGRPKHDPWEWWHALRASCDYHSSLAIELTSDLPPSLQLDRWIGEPVKLVLIPTSVFLTNAAKRPTLPKAHQAFLLKLFGHKDVQYVVTGKPHHGDPNGTPHLYLQYLEHLHTMQAPLTQQEAYEAPYYDYLQTPLQPLMDNLESQTYEVFEQDPIKYRNYEEAVYQALLKRHTEDEEVLLMVVGAGRGPLVRASLRAAKRAKRRLRVYAVEKNPNAVITLRNLHRSQGWGDQVTIISCDMRDWDAPEKADILVSELLGSWGDNELSPECLDGAQMYLKDDGISIPSSYTSFLAPITTNKLWNHVRDGESAGYQTDYTMETGYVVKLHDFTQLGDSKPVFRFEHPNRAERIDNSRYIKLQWVAKENALMHGFVGYFESVLFEHVDISINPETFSEGMFSWFPMYFPIKNPVYVKKGDTIEVHWWRCVTDKKVWYEWNLTSPEVSSVHNANGKRYYIGL